MLDAGIEILLTVAETGNLTRAGERLLLSQPTVSLQLKRLEEQLGRSLMKRSPRSLALTAKGETLLSYAQRLLALADEAVARLVEPTMHGLVRLETPEDFATIHLSGVLARFAEAHPNVALEVTTDLTLNLIERCKEGEFDIVLIKREPLGPTEGVRVWRKPLVWASTRADPFERADRCPSWCRRILASTASGPPRPSTGRERLWRIAYTSTSLAGAQVAVRAGLGATVLPKEMVPEDFFIIDTGAGAPDLSDTEIALMTVPALSIPAERLAHHVVRSLERKEGAIRSWKPHKGVPHVI